VVQRLTMLAPVEREKGTGGPTPDQKQRWKAWYVHSSGPIRRDPYAVPALRVGVRARVETRELCNRRKARKSFEHDPSQDPDGGAIPDITYPHLGNRNVGNVEKPPSAVQRLQDRSTDLLGVWRQDPTPTHPFGLDKFKGLHNTRRGQVCLCADRLAVLSAHYGAGQSAGA